MLATAFHDLLEFCLAAECGACGAPADKEGFLCPVCSAALDRLIDEPACDRCGMPLAAEGTSCVWCRGKGQPHYDRIVALGRFDEPLKGLIHRVKYGGQWTTAERLAMRLLDMPRAACLLSEADRIVPVPLHPNRQFSRGFNQAEVIARQLDRRRVVRPAVRRRNTATQTQLRSRARRVENLRGAFSLIDPESIAGKHIVVVDDVTTSGATLREMARTLVAANPASLSAIVLAVADPKGRDFQAV
jgi:ComF family protein